jgi:hypothetical protein
VPTEVPTAVPSDVPSNEPSEVPTEVPSAVPTEVPTISAAPTLNKGVSGSWCVQIGLFDSFGDGWGEGAKLRIYDKNDPVSYLDISNPATSVVETTVCLDSSRSLQAEVICYDCDLREPWEMYYTVTETKQRNPKFYVGGYDTVMSLRHEDIRIRRNPIDDKDIDRKCSNRKCYRDRGGNRYDDIVIDATGEGERLRKLF